MLPESPLKFLFGNGSKETDESLELLLVERTSFIARHLLERQDAFFTWSYGILCPGRFYRSTGTRQAI